MKRKNLYTTLLKSVKQKIHLCKTRKHEHLGKTPKKKTKNWTQRIKLSKGCACAWSGCTQRGLQSLAAWSNGRHFDWNGCHCCVSVGVQWGAIEWDRVTGVDEMNGANVVKGSNLEFLIFWKPTISFVWPSRAWSTPSKLDISRAGTVNLYRSATMSACLRSK